MKIRDPRTGTRLPEPICQEVFEIVMDTQQWVRQASHSRSEMACSSVLLAGSDADLKHGYAAAVAYALGVDSHRLSVHQCLERPELMRRTFADAAEWGGVVIIDGLDLLTDDRYAGIRDEIIDILDSQVMADRPLVIIGTAHSDVEEDMDLASRFGRVGVLTHKGLARVDVAQEQDMGMALAL